MTRTQQLMRRHAEAAMRLKETNPRLHEAIRREALKDIEKRRGTEPPKKQCPMCGGQVRVLIHEINDGCIVKTFCHNCRGQVN